MEDLRKLWYKLNMPSLSEIKEKATPILKSAGATRAAIFGSYARGEETPESDIDILVDLPRGLSLLDVVGLKFELEDILGKKVDLVEYDAIKPIIRNSILASQLQIL